jgi:hypothetical protein
MSWRRIVLAACTLAGVVVALPPLTAGAGAAADGDGGRDGVGEQRRAIVAFYAADPQDVLVYPAQDDEPPIDGMLRLLGSETGVRAGLWSSAQGGYARQQVLLDISQGTRQPTGLYSDVDEDGDDELDELRFDLASRAFANWEPFRARATDVSRTLRPGLLGGSVPGGAAFVTARGAPLQPAIVAADERGRVAEISRGKVSTLAARARASTQRLVVVSVPFGRVGQAQLSQLARQRAPDELLLIIQLPRTPQPGQTGLGLGRYLRQPALAIGDGRAGSVRSGSTRRDGLVSSIDFAPTILEWIGVQAPDRMRGAVIATGAPLGTERLEELRRRWANARDGRQAASLGAIVTLAVILFLLLGTWRGVRAGTRPVLRIGALAVLWWPSVVLLAAALEPATRQAEVFLIAGVSLVLAALCERLLAWARAPLVPALTCLVAYSADLAFGGPLLTMSVLGPSVGAGSRFYGVSNELEPILPIVLLIGLAAFATGRELTRRMLALYACAGVGLLVVVGWGRLGADVGGVITVGAGVAVAAVAMVPGRLTARRLAIAALAPVGALVLLIAIDLGLSGESHLSRNLLRAGDPSELWELVTRRYELSWGILTSGDNLAYFLGALLAVAFAWRNRARIYPALPHRAWAAALIGGLAAGLAGALTNDSGPILFINAVGCLAALTAYILGRPDDAISPGIAERRGGAS